MNSTQACNALRGVDLFKIANGTVAHADASAAVATADATDAASAATLATALISAWNSHYASVADSSGVGVHGASVGSAIVAPVTALRACLSELQTKLNAHMQTPGAHIGPDRTNLSAYLPRDGGGAETALLANDIKAKMNAHFANALAMGTAS